jgi:hypothetical protein
VLRDCLACAVPDIRENRRRDHVTFDAAVAGSLDEVEDREQRIGLGYIGAAIMIEQNAAAGHIIAHICAGLCHVVHDEFPSVIPNQDGDRIAPVLDVEGCRQAQAAVRRGETGVDGMRR